jgi:DNA-binding Lrp family transcriptional regulator
MPHNVIPEDVRLFIFENIDSIAQLEGLLLFRANPDARYNAQTIAERLYISPEESAALLEQLEERGFLENADADYFYAPRSPDFGGMIDKLADIYSHYLLAVTHFIHSKSKSRVQEFANAFRIRKD